MNRLGALGKWARLALVVMVLNPVAAVAGYVCASCNEPIRGEFQLHQNPARPEPQRICQSCAALPTRCALCKLPVKHKLTKLDDGRLLCEYDAARGIFDEKETQRMFEALKGDLFPLFSGLGTLPDRNVLVRLVDNRQMAAAVQSTGGQPDQINPMAFARSRRSEGSPWEHEIYVMQGLGQAHLLAALAHEYTHLWLRENLPPQRRLEKNTLEGFCELVAYQIMSRRGDEVQKRAILANAYTRGQVQTFLKVHQEHPFYRVVQWIKLGAATSFPTNNTAAVLNLEKEAPKPDIQLASLQPVATPVPEQLTLKGVSGGPGRRLALINDQTLRQNEVATVRVGAKRVQVRCLEVGEQSARIQVDGQPQPLELQLETKR